MNENDKAGAVETTLVYIAILAIGVLFWWGVGVLLVGGH